MNTRFWMLCGTLVVSGCTMQDAIKSNPIYGEKGVIRDRGQEYALAQPGKRLVIPEGINAKSTEDLLQVPEINESEVVSNELVPEAPRPEFFFAVDGNDRASIRPLEGERVILVDEPIDQVWVELKPFWQDANINLAIADPKTGVMESEWIEVAGEDLNYFQRLLNTVKFNSEANEPSLNKLRVRLRPDPDNTERTAISMEHAQIALSADKSELDWSSDATELAYSNEIMFAMLNYLGKGDVASTAPTLSRFQVGSGPTAQMGKDSRNQPLLNIRASADEAWVMVNDALDRAGVDVGTRDKESGAIYLTFKSTLKEQEYSGFLDWLKNRESGPITLDLVNPNSVEDPIDKDVVYSSDPDAIVKGAKATQEELQAMDGFKVWVGKRVVYVFGQDNQKRVNSESGDLELYKRFQVRFNRARTGVILSVHNDKGEPVSSESAEEFLWTVKDNLSL